MIDVLFIRRDELNQNTKGIFLEIIYYIVSIIIYYRQLISHCLSFSSQ